MFCAFWAERRKTTIVRTARGLRHSFDADHDLDRLGVRVELAHFSRLQELCHRHTRSRFVSQHVVPELVGHDSGQVP
jgi:hypothetical protein